jgi:hypothetical protein
MNQGFSLVAQPSNTANNLLTKEIILGELIAKPALMPVFFLERR